MPKKLKGALCDFLTSIQLQSIEKIKVRPFEDIENISKKVSQYRKN